MRAISSIAPLALGGIPSRPTGPPVTAGEFCRAILHDLVCIGAFVVGCVAAAVIFGYFFVISSINLSSMRINAACGLLAGAAALWCLHTCASGSAWIRVARALATIVAVIGGLSLAQDLLGIELGIDQLITPATQEGPLVLHPGRMSPATASSLAFIGFALLTLKARHARLAACAHWLVVPPMLAATLAIIGYAYGVSALYTLKPHTSMAAHTAVSFLVLGLSVLAADSAHGFAKIATSDTAGGIVSRRLLPTLPGILFVLGWVGLQGQVHGMYDARFGLALMVLFSIMVCIIAVISTANLLHTVDLTRQRAEAEILTLNVGLELRVQERTHELAQVSSQLSLVNAALEKLSRQDGLTGLANRRFFDFYLAEQIEIARRHRRTVALVLCDVDAFKAYNDHYGHPTGDACLKQIAAALQSCCRRSADMAARYGGEEFAMILPETKLDAALQIAEAARDAVARLKITHPKSPTAAFITVSGGIAVLLRGGDMSAQQLIADADQALFQAKHLGRNRMVAADAEKILLAG